MQPQTEEAYDLLHRSSIALAHISANGMRVDVDYLHRVTKETGERVTRMIEDLKKTDFWKTWHRKYGDQTSIHSRTQVGDILFNVMGYPCLEKTPTGRPMCDIEALERIDHPFVSSFVRMEKLSKLYGTYLKGLVDEVVGEFVHPFFHLHTVATYRTSSSDPNFQNLPIRDGETSEILRKAFIPRDGHLIIENDFKGIEVCAAACYNLDPVLIEYIKDPKKDMHRDCAMKLFCIDDPKKVTKDTRYVAKNQFVFPGFYGSYYVKIAHGLWAGMLEKRITYEGEPMTDWLAKNGIFELGECDPKQQPREGTFEKHVKEYEEWYWKVQYTEYTRWKKMWYEEYLRTGGFSSLTGFYYEGIFEKNQVLNYPIQGTACHWLLWVLVRMQAWLTKNKMRSKIVGQIHDSIIGDVHESEKDDYLAKMKRLVTVDLPAYWKWINVPLSVEAEVTPVNGTWYDKKSIEI